MVDIVATPGVLGGKARLEGRRISVIDIAERILDYGQEPEYVADQLDVPLADVHSALAYYYRHLEEMKAVRERRRELEDELERLSEAPERVEP
jgi:uncharacterized protein (DUF433 family)